MASMAPNTKNHRRRTLEAQTNLVPYIDLMITIITFLMMTSVWTQIAALEIQNGSDSIAAVAPSPVKSLSVIVTKNDYVVFTEGKRGIKIAKVDAQYDLQTLEAHMKKFKAQDEKRFQVNIKADDKIAYENIVEIIDVAMGSGLSGITLNPRSV